MVNLPLPTWGDERDMIVADLFDINRKISAAAQALCGPKDPPEITLQQLRVLELICRNPAMSLHQLSERLQVSNPTASGIVDRLVEKQMVTRADDSKDRRVRRIVPTPAGQEQLARLGSVFGEMLTKVISRIGIDDLKVIRNSFQVILNAIDEAQDADE